LAAEKHVKTLSFCPLSYKEDIHESRIVNLSTVLPDIDFAIDRTSTVGREGVILDSCRSDKTSLSSKDYATQPANLISEAQNWSYNSCESKYAHQIFKKKSTGDITLTEGANLLFSRKGELGGKAGYV